MIKKFIENYIYNLIAMVIVVIICCAVVGILYLLDTYFGTVGLILGIVALLLVWTGAILYSDAKKETDKEE